MNSTNKLIVAVFMYLLFLGLYIEGLVLMMTAADTMSNLLGLISILAVYLLSVKYFRKFIFTNKQ